MIAAVHDEGIVGRDHDAGPLVGDGADVPHDDSGVGGVECAGGFVGEDQFGGNGSDRKSVV